jgi:RNA recognition motif-containing protein
MGKKLFVGNLSYDTTGEDLKELFSQAGTCESASVITDRATGRSRGFGFVEMSTPSEAERATNELNGHELQGRRLTVSEARERTGGGGGGGGGRGGFGGGGGGGGGRGGFGGGGGGGGGGRRRY